MPQSSFADYVVNDLLSGVRGVRSRKMFGGFGIFKDDLMFAIIVDDELYFKVDDSNRKDFEKRGSTPFQYEAKGRGKVSLSYWKLPAEVMDDRREIEEWAEKSIRTARRRSKKRSG